MRQARAWAGAVAVAAGLAAAGCNDAGPPKRSLAQPVEDGTQPTPPAAPAKVAKPARTDPTAEAVIDKLLAAHAGGKPEAVEPLKTYRLTRTGRFVGDGGPGAAVWTVTAAWPDKFRQQTVLTDRGNVVNVTARDGAAGWKLLRIQGMAQPAPLTAIEMNALQTDIYAEWMALLVPLLDRAGRVAAPVEPAAVNGKPTVGVRVWVGDYPPVVLRADAGSGLLVRVEYQLTDPTGTVPLMVRFDDHKPVKGVTLPGKSEYTVNNRLISEWAGYEYEFPFAAAPDAFAKP